ncbi:MAG: CatB-related O-acetyltransferase [Cetobacterium sp.]|uniref:CatB-related O-acetyltransferase n=1 Tax=Cetobacterium sp. TaxID=2071632 RepID=UPI003F395266
MLKKVKEIILKFLDINTEVDKKIKKNKTIDIKKDVFIDRNCIIGDYTYIGPRTIITKSKIARYVSIGSDVKIGLGEHITDRVSLNTFFYKNPYDELTKGECIIEDDVWIGTNVVILRNVKIGRGAVIGAGAVVTKDVEPYSIVVGVPAKFLKYRFSREKIEEIEKSKWWSQDLNEAKNKMLILEKKNEDRISTST